MTNRIKEFLISIGIVATMFVIFGLILPSSRHMSAEVETNRKPSIVFDNLDSFERWKEWNPIATRDPFIKTKLSGAASGKGHKLDYMSSVPKDGVGSWEITDVVPEKSIDVKVDNSAMGFNKRMKFSLTRAGRMKRNTNIVQAYDVDYGWNLFGRYAGMYVSGTVGEDLKSGMKKFGNMLALIPNFDYHDLVTGDTTTDPKFGKTEEKNLLFISVEVPRADGPLKSSFADAQRVLNSLIAERGLVADGPAQIHVTNFGQSTFAFDLAQPVKKPGATGKLDIPVGGQIKYAYYPAGDIAIVPAVGTYNDLPKYRNALKGWVESKGAQIDGRPFEVWQSGLEGSLTPAGTYNVMYRVKNAPAAPAAPAADGAAKPADAAAKPADAAKTP